jgi:hypothetical protein
MGTINILNAMENKIIDPIIFFSKPISNLQKGFIIYQK